MVMFAIVKFRVSKKLVHVFFASVSLDKEHKNFCLSFQKTFENRYFQNVNEAKLNVGNVVQHRNWNIEET